MLAWLLTAQMLTAAGPALHVTVSKDRTLSCKANALLEKAVRLRLPRVRVAPEGKAGAQDLVASLQRVGGSEWRFEVRRGDGTVAMSRELQAMACPQLADLSALILERFLSSLAWEGKDVAVAPVGPGGAPRPTERPTERPAERPAVHPEPSRGVTPPEVEETPPIVASVEEPPAPPSTALGVTGGGAVFAPPSARPPPSPLQPPPLAHLTLSVGGGAWLGAPFEASPTLELGLGLRLAQRFHASLLFLAGASTVRGVSVNNLPRGSLTLQSFAGLGTFALCTSGFALCGGLVGGARVTTGTAAGPTTGPRVFAPTTRTAALPELGGYGRLVIPLLGRFSLAADLAIAAPLGRAAFGIDGIASSTVLTPAVDFTGSLALSLKIF